MSGGEQSTLWGDVTPEPAEEPKRKRQPRKAPSAETRDRIASHVLDWRRQFAGGSVTREEWARWCRDPAEERTATERAWERLRADLAALGAPTTHSTDPDTGAARVHVTISAELWAAGQAQPRTEEDRQVDLTAAFGALAPDVAPPEPGAPRANRGCFAEVEAVRASMDALGALSQRGPLALEILRVAARGDVFAAGPGEAPPALWAEEIGRELLGLRGRGDELARWLGLALDDDGMVDRDAARNRLG